MNSKLKISENSAFKVYKPKPVKFDPYKLFVDLIESGQLAIAENNKILTPFEGSLYLENIHVKIDEGVIKVVSPK
jgi:hypothetical protein